MMRNAENCEANHREGEEYLRVVLAESGATRVVGEDLGTVPGYVRPSLRSLGIAGFKIPQWEFLHGQMTPGNEFERLSVTTYATHDHKPIRELWAEALDEKAPTHEQAREDLLKIAQFSGIVPREGLEYERDFYPAMMSALFNSNSWIAIVMITDLLARKDRFNVPGTTVDDELGTAFAENDRAIARQPHNSAQNKSDSRAAGEKRREFASDRHIAQISAD